MAAYERRWNVDPRRPLRLQEYRDRTLYTTWNLSYARLEADDPLAAKVLQLFAYFDNQEIWFELLHAGLTEDLPAWVQELSADRLDFDSVMRMLVDYCLVEVHSAAESYSTHSCVHDWTLGELNQRVETELYWYAFDCVAVSGVDDEWELLGQTRYARVTRHAVRLVHQRFQEHDRLVAIASGRLDQAVWIAALLARQVQLTAAEKMYTRALGGKEKALRRDHTSTLRTVNNLGNLYRD